MRQCSKERRESKEVSKDQESIQSSNTPDPGHHMGKSQKHKKTSHTREPIDSPFQSGGHKATWNRQISMTKTKTKHKITKMIHKRSTALEWSLRKLLEGLYMFDGTNFTPISNVDQDT